jgi:hypothetical protein
VEHEAPLAGLALVEVVEVQLPHKAGDLPQAEVLRDDLGLQPLGVQDQHTLPRAVPPHDPRVPGLLHTTTTTSNIENNLRKNLLSFPRAIFCVEYFKLYV